jgi:hypothetical protein
MDRKKFDEKVEEYLFFDKRSLAELLAMRDLKEEESNEGMMQLPVTYRVKRFCTAINGYCYDNNCNGCLFSQLKPSITEIDESRMFLVDPENLPRYGENTNVSSTRTFGYVYTSTTGKIG